MHTVIEPLAPLYEMDVLAEQMQDNSSTGSAQREFLKAVIAEFDKSTSRAYMDIAEKYYRNEGDILEKKRMVYGRTDAGPQLMESANLSNNKITHNFFKKLVRQKIGYMLGKPFTFSATKSDDEIAEAMFKELQNYLGKDFFKRIKNIGRDAIMKGIAWLLAYYNEEGKLKFKRIAPEEGIPLWADSDHTELDAFIRHFSVEVYKGGEKTYVRYVDYYTLEGVYHYIYNIDGELVRDPDHSQFPEPYFLVRSAQTEEGSDVVGGNWTKLPIIPFKYDPDEQSLLVRIKTLIDDYDKKCSDISDDIDDFPNSQKLVKNYDGASKEEFVTNMSQYHVMFVGTDGDAKALVTPLDIKDIDVYLQRLREDIYEFGQGVNTADKDIRDTSGVALRFLYADLDMDCIDWSSELEWSLMQLIWFIQQDILAKGGEDYTQVKYNIIFNTDVIVNETETINNCAISEGVISAKTIAANHPWTLDAQKEIDALKNSKEESLDLEAEYGKAPSTGRVASPSSAT